MHILRSVKKIFLLFFAAFIGFSIMAQGPQQLVNIPTGQGTTAQAWLYLPADYNTSNKKYPVLFFYHGAGEAGTNPNVMFYNGIPRLIAEGMRPDNIINPVDGQSYSFIVLSAQHWNWSPNPEWLPAELNWMKQQYRIDTNRVYVTGLSAGGQQAFQVAVSNPAVSSLIAASVPLSPPSPGNYDINMISTYRIKTWFFSGDQDPITPNVQIFNQQCNAVYPSSSRISIYGGGHCCWNTFYNTNWKDPVSGWSIWEWLLTCKREPALPVTISQMKVTDLGDKHIKVEFNCENPRGNEVFYIQVKIKGVIRKIAITPADRTGTNTYIKIINLN